MAKKFANFFATKLKTDIDAIQTSIAVDTLPRDKDNNIITAGRVVIEARNKDRREIVKFTGVDVGTTLLTGCTRGDGRTTASIHSKGALTEMNLTAEDITDLYDYFDVFTNTYPMKGLFDNAIINGGCIIAQRVTAPAVTTAYQYGAVDRFAAKATGTAVTAGTIAQNNSPLAVLQGSSLQLAGMTITGAGILFVRYRMEAKDAVRFKNKFASFGVSVHHAVGTPINYTILINKPTVADNFAAVTNVATSAALPVANNVATQIKLQNINLGDVSNGIEIEIQVACGAVTAKSFDFGEFIFNQGALLGVFMPKHFEHELLACMRYYEKSNNYETDPGASAGIANGGSFAATHYVVIAPSNTSTSGARTWKNEPFKVAKRANPTMRYWDGAGNISRNSVGDANLGTTYTNQAEAFRGINSYRNGFVFQAAPTGNWWWIMSFDADAEL